MPPFVYQPYHAPFVQSISALMEQPGQIAGNAAIAEAQARGQAIQGAGNAAAGAIQQINDPRLQMERQQLAISKATQASIARANQIALNTPRTEDGTRDYDALDRQLDAAGVMPQVKADMLKSWHDAESYAKDERNAKLEKHAALGNSIYQAISALPKDATPDQQLEVAHQVAGNAKADGFANDNDLAQFFSQVHAGVPINALALGLMGQSPSKRFDDVLKPQKLAGAVRPGAAPETLVGPTGNVVATGQAAQPVAPRLEPNVVFKTPDGVEHPVTFDANGRALYNGQDVTSQVTRPTPTPTPPTAQAKSYRVKGVGDVPLEFVPGRTPDQPGSYFLNKPDGTRQQLYPGKDFVDIPPASLQLTASGVPDIPLTDKQKKIAADLATGVMPFRDFNSLYSARNGQTVALKQAIYNEARDINPDFNIAAFEAGQKLFSNPQIRQRMVAIDQLTPVVDRITKLMDKSGNTDMPALNKLILGAKFQLGDQTATDLRQLQTLLGDEVGNALGVGTGTDLKTRLGLDLVNPNLSPSNFKDTMHQLQTTLHGRRENLQTMMGPYGGETLQKPSAAQAAVLKGLKPGVHTLSDGSKWMVGADNSITKQ